jgi:hypothetical protein
VAGEKQFLNADFGLHPELVYGLFSQEQATPGTPCIRVNTHKRRVQARKRWAQAE